MYISPINSNISNHRANRNSNKIRFGSAIDLSATKEMMINFVSKPENKKILQSGDRMQIGKKLLEYKNSLTEKILDLNPGSRLNAINREETLIYDKNNKYIGAISQIPSGDKPIHIGYFDSATKQDVVVESIQCEILGDSRLKYGSYQL